jgi:hypothetical protein
MDNIRGRTGKFTDNYTDVRSASHMACESEQGECKVSQEAVDIQLQEYPRRLRLSTVEKRFSTMQGIEPDTNHSGYSKRRNSLSIRIPTLRTVKRTEKDLQQVFPGKAVPRRKVCGPSRLSLLTERHAVDALYQQRTSTKTITSNLSHSPLWRI